MEVTLCDNQNELLGVFIPKEGMRFLAITDLAFDKYKYQIFAKKGEEILAESNVIEFTLSRPNYSGKPIR